MQISKINPRYSVQFLSFKSAENKPSSSYPNNDELMRFLDNIAIMGISQVGRSNIDSLLKNVNINALLNSAALNLSDIKEIAQMDENSFNHCIELIGNKNFLAFLTEKSEQIKSKQNSYSDNYTFYSSCFSYNAIKNISALEDNAFKKYLDFFNSQIIFDNIKKGNIDFIYLAKVIQNDVFGSDDLLVNLEKIFSNETLKKANKTLIYSYEEDYLSFARQDRISFDIELEKIENILKNKIIINASNKLGKIGFRQLRRLSNNNDTKIQEILGKIKYLTDKTVEVNKKYSSQESLIRADGIVELSLSKQKTIDKFKQLLENEGFLEMREKLDLSINDIESLINLTDENFNKYNKLINNKCVQKAINEGLFDKDSFASLITLSDESVENIDSFIKEIKEQKKTVLKHPELYINGEILNYQDAKDNIDYFFTLNSAGMAIFLEYSDKETLNHLLRQRFDNAQNDLIIFLTFSQKLKELYSKLIHSVNNKNKPFTPSQKLQFVTLIQAYEDLRAGFNELNEMAINGVVDLDKLNFNLIRNIMIKMGLSENEINSASKEDLALWDISNLHYLSQYTYNPAFMDIMKGGLINFKEYIQDDNKYGKINLNTKKEFEDNNLNYENWINPSPDLNVIFKTENSQEQSDEIIKQIEKDMQTLLNTNIRDILNKRFSYCIKNDIFKIPDEINTKEKLIRFTKNIIEQLNDVWIRAKENQHNPLKRKNADRTLAILMHLKSSLYDIENMKNKDKIKPFDLKIKMWDRILQKDLFQGNYSTCCIAMGGTNAQSVPHYLLNTAYNMIEIIDNTDNKTIGNALCYFVKNDNNQPVFVIDDIEINNNIKPEDYETGINLRNAVIKYAKNISKSVAGRNDIPIYIAGTRFNDVPVDDLNSKFEKVTFIGDIDCDEIYMDLYSGETYKDKIKKENLVFTHII